MFLLVTAFHTADFETRAAARAAARAMGLGWGAYRVILANQYDDEAEAEAVCDAKRRIEAHVAFYSALTFVESESIRTWARTSNNRWLFCRLAYTNILAGKPLNTHRFATFIVCSAIGL